MPTRLSIQQWLADRMEQVSTSRASNDRKALRSLFSFLYTEGLWPNNPTIGLSVHYLMSSNCPIFLDDLQTEKHPCRMTLEQKKEKAKELYEREWSLSKIARYFGVSKSTVFNWLHDYPYPKKRKLY